MVDTISRKNYRKTIEGFKKAFEDGYLTFAVVDTGGMRHVGYAQDFYSKAFPDRNEPSRIYLRQKDTFILEQKNEKTGELEKMELQTSEGYEERHGKIHPIYRPLLDGICNPYEISLPIKERTMLDPGSIKGLPKNDYMLTIDDSIISAQSTIGTVIHLLNYKGQLNFKKLFTYVNRDEQGRVANFVREGRGDKSITMLKMLQLRAPIEFEEFKSKGLLESISDYMPDMDMSMVPESEKRREVVKDTAAVLGLIGLFIGGGKRR